MMSLPKLHQTIIEGAFELFTTLLEQGSDVNQLDPVMGNAPLHIAAQQTSDKWVNALLDAGAFINIQTPKHGVTPLIIAVWHRKPGIVDALLARPDVNAEIVSTFGVKAEDLLDFGGSDSDMFGCEQTDKLKALFSQYKQRRVELEQALSAYQIVTQVGKTDKEKVAQLEALEDWSLLNATSPITSSGNDEHTAVMVAARDGLVESLRLLMARGGDQTIPDHYMKAIPLHKAAYNGQADVIKILVNYPGFEETLNAQGPNNGYTPLHDAIWHGHKEAAKALIDAGARTDVVSFDGKTPLELAKEYHYQDIIDLLENK
ncbi:ankyrin repeat domain-containing protein [Vibrio sp. YIC-376]|uniref:ankyrin repeat domain-containing protein n=1 Tax=Vibrio sp. YIC-376 TaxID=3136162 RepID=UPI00402A72FC